MEEKPHFSEGDFKNVLYKNYQKVHRLTKKEIKVGRNEDLLEKIKNKDTVNLVFDETLNLWSVLGLENNQFFPVFSSKEAPQKELLNIITQMEEEEKNQFPLFIRQLRNIYLLCLKLLNKGAFFPRLLQRDEDYFIQWVPATFSKEVKAVIEEVQEHLLHQNISVKTSTGVKHLSKKEGVNVLCHLFLQDFLSKDTVLLNAEGRLLNLFFYNRKEQFNGVGEIEVPRSINQWLQKFQIVHKEYVPVIQLQEVDENYYVNVMIEKEGEALEPIALATFWKDEKYKAFKFDLLQDLLLVASYFPALKEHINSKGQMPLMYDNVEIVSVLFDIFPVIELLGINLMMPKVLRKILQPGKSLKADTSESVDEGVESFMDLQKLLRFKWQVALGDEQISREEFMKKYAHLSGLVKVNNQYVLFDQKELKQLLKELETPPAFKANEISQALFSEEIQGSPLTFSNELKKGIRQITDVKEIHEPEGLQATLRPYQKAGFEWMYRNTKVGFGSLIADDMGLGKTLQVITLLLKLKTENYFKSKKALIVVPTSLLTNWESEIERFAPDLSAFVYHGAKRKFADDFDVLITTYGMVRNSKDELKKLKWAVMVIDEAQNIKNTATQQTKLIKSIKADTYIGMSGTPVENRLSEYWSVMDFANKGYLGTLSNFSKNIAKPIQQDKDFKVLERFKKITQPFILRRVKTDKSIISDLPDKIEKNQFINLAPEQVVVYEEFVQSALEEIEKNDGSARRGMVLKMMLGLKQVCDHPNLLLKSNQEEDPMHSTKVQRLFELVEEIVQKGEKVLIFTQYKTMGDLLQKWIEDRMKKKPQFLHGGSSRKNRDEMVSNFQDNRTDNIFILSLKAAGTGLNLTAANHVIHFDLWWNPAVEAQATDRAYRIGQNKNVMVHRMICKGTIEEKIDKMIQSKKELSDLTVAEGETWIGNLSDAELKEMVKLSEIE
ncbi:DEAD/DEAH box helicase [Flammeovirga sp. SJP92]|uniref:DEAD/DEAH box helicase n=1 Tax=Flammeovirga sp. SJP92 TaxID=1775430 RepID=UPI0007888381|nr:DEAD/DEAH box helicase [Flammeovirga sp. SJP92]KXX72616.1 hypothetical protein AVL50_06335 [Flammeovirga sp. SJP92]